MAVEKFFMHLLLEHPEGGIRSEPGGTTFQMGSASRWRFACRPPAAAKLTKTDRGTPLPFHVRCDACRQTADFKAIDRPRPGGGGSVEMVADGCCD